MPRLYLWPRASFNDNEGGSHSCVQEARPNPPSKDNIHIYTCPHICVNLCIHACVRKYTHKHAPTTHPLGAADDMGSRKRSLGPGDLREAGSCCHCPSQQVPGVALSGTLPKSAF